MADNTPLPQRTTLRSDSRKNTEHNTNTNTNTNKNTNNTYTTKRKGKNKNDKDNDVNNQETECTQVSSGASNPVNTQVSGDNNGNGPYLDSLLLSQSQTSPQIQGLEMDDAHTLLKSTETDIVTGNSEIMEREDDTQIYENGGINTEQENTEANNEGVSKEQMKTGIGNDNAKQVINEINTGRKNQKPKDKETEGNNVDTSDQIFNIDYFNRTMTQQRFRAISREIMKATETKTKMGVNYKKELGLILDMFAEMVDIYERKLAIAEAKEQVYDEIRSLIVTPRAEETQENNGKIMNNKEKRQYDETKSSYANAVKQASSTVIIRGEDNRSPQDVRNQIENIAEPLNMAITEVRPIRNGIRIACDTIENAIKLQHHLKIDNEKINNLKIQNANIPKKKIIIYNVPNHITDEQLTRKIELDSGIDMDGSIGNIKINNHIRSTERTDHIPVLLPAPLADFFLNKGMICIGVHRCYIKQYVTVMRCHNCQGYDHVAAVCRGKTSCMKCGGEHNANDCNNNHLKCINCSKYNEASKDWQGIRVKVDHATNSKVCWVFRTLFTLRQLEQKKGLARLSQVDSIFYGFKGIKKVNGNFEIFTRPERNPVTLRRQNSRKNNPNIVRNNNINPKTVIPPLLETPSTSTDTHTQVPTKLNSNIKRI